MEFQTIALFTATVLPLICTPGPDMLFVASQALSAGTIAGLRATAGVCLGYMIHSALVACGVAAIIAASPLLFEGLRWLGIAYLIYLACRLIRSSLTPGILSIAAKSSSGQLKRGFLTALFNPKGMMIYIAILPQFMREGSNGALQAGILSAVFVCWCAVVYTLLSIAIGKAGHRSGFNDRRRRTIEASAGGLLIIAATFMAGH
ncbi:LysE family translocator [Hyphomicrobiales bacterium]|uniref:LysE family translocator n=1 Tax=Phyllobacterium sp. 22552 TaxID=3453941 RepID=UPI000E0FECB2